MTLKTRLKQDFMENYKARNQNAVMVLRSVNAAIATEEKSGKTAVEFSDDQVEKLIAREVKKRRATADEFAKVGETERSEKETWEAEFLAQYLPEQLSEDEIRGIVQEVLDELGPDAQQGMIMKNVMSQVKGKADGKLVKQVVDSLR